MSTRMRFDSDHLSARSPYFGRHRKTAQIRSAWRLIRRRAPMPGVPFAAAAAGPEADRLAGPHHPAS